MNRWPLFHSMGLFCVIAKCWVAARNAEAIDCGLWPFHREESKLTRSGLGWFERVVRRGQGAAHLNLGNWLVGCSARVMAIISALLDRRPCFAADEVLLIYRTNSRRGRPPVSYILSGFDRRVIEKIARVFPEIRTDFLGFDTNQLGGKLVGALVTLHANLTRSHVENSVVRTEAALSLIAEAAGQKQKRFRIGPEHEHIIDHIHAAINGHRDLTESEFEDFERLPVNHVRVRRAHTVRLEVVDRLLRSGTGGPLERITRIASIFASLLQITPACLEILAKELVRIEDFESWRVLRKLILNSKGLLIKFQTGGQKHVCKVTGGADCTDAHHAIYRMIYGLAAIEDRQRHKIAETARMIWITPMVSPLRRVPTTPAKSPFLSVTRASADQIAVDVQMLLKDLHRQLIDPRRWFGFLLDRTAATSFVPHHFPLMGLTGLLKYFRNDERRGSVILENLSDDIIAHAFRNDPLAHEVAATWATELEFAVRRRLIASNAGRRYSDAVLARFGDSIRVCVEALSVERVRQKNERLVLDVDRLQP